MSKYICDTCRSSLRQVISRARRPCQVTSAIRTYSAQHHNRTRSEPQDSTVVLKEDAIDDISWGTAAAWTGLRRREISASEAHPDRETKVPTEKSVGTFQRIREQPSRNSHKPCIDITSLLATPSWSVRSLNPNRSSPSVAEDEITPKKLYHLLRLSALPLPRNKEEEDSMLATLHSQLHFVQDIQKVNTDGVKPLQSIRDETVTGTKEMTISMESLKEAFSKEEIKGRNRRPRRRRNDTSANRTQGVEDWDSLSTATDIIERGGGRYFVVRSGKGPQDRIVEETPEIPEVRQWAAKGSLEKLTKLSRQESLNKRQGQHLADPVFVYHGIQADKLAGGGEGLSKHQHSRDLSNHKINIEGVVQQPRQPSTARDSDPYMPRVRKILHPAPVKVRPEGSLLRHQRAGLSLPSHKAGERATVQRSKAREIIAAQISLQRGRTKSPADVEKLISQPRQVLKDKSGEVSVPRA
jgi:Asp-tRNA(Asn)/Glu-tRNA(Gln) amidotransferase C subunit